VRLTQTPGGPWSGTFTLTAVGGPVSYSVTEPGGDYLIVSPASGDLTAGESVTISVEVNPNNPPPTFETGLTVDPGGISVTVEYPPSG
jgi:hypothetical protein